MKPVKKRCSNAKSSVKLCKCSTCAPKEFITFGCLPPREILDLNEAISFTYGEGNELERSTPATDSCTESDVEADKPNVFRMAVKHAKRAKSWFGRVVERAVTFCVPSVAEDMFEDELLQEEIALQMTNPDCDDDTNIAVSLGLCKTQKATAVAYVPKLVVRAVVSLRMKLGRGAMVTSGPVGAGNRALVRATTVKLLRDWNVRDIDAAAHLYAIERAFFEDDTHYRVHTWRARAAQESRFVKWFVGANSSQFDF